MHASQEAALTELREKVRLLQAARRPAAGLCPTGLPPLDRALGGGLATASLHEFLAPGGQAPIRTLALRAAMRMLTAGDLHGRRFRADRWLMYLDTLGDFYPPAAARLGLPLERLLVIRVRRLMDALWTCEQALRCPAVGVVIATMRAIDPYASRRLQLAAEAGGGLGILLRHEEARDITFAASRLRFTPRPSPAGFWRTQVEVLKLREGRPGDPFVLELAHDGRPRRTAADPSSVPARTTSAV